MCLIVKPRPGLKVGHPDGGWKSRWWLEELSEGHGQAGQPALKRQSTGKREKEMPYPGDGGVHPEL